jgi:hypothetical protein
MNVAMPPSAVLMEEEDVGITIIAAGGEEEA